MLIDCKDWKNRCHASALQVLITSTLPFYGKADFTDVDVVVEAVVENIKVKHIVLAEVEKVCVSLGRLSHQTHHPFPLTSWLYGTSRKFLWYAFL